MQQVSRYHPALVVLHWLLALMIIGLLLAGFFVMNPMPNTDPKKLDILMLHMSAGITILALMLIRYAIRRASARPPMAQTGHPLLDRLARVVHSSFYLVVVLMAASGITTALLAGLNRSVFQRDGEPLPAHFGVFPSFKAHALLALLLAALVLMHVGAALWHQFIRHDGLIRRMSFGKR
jgi:cytochrome b561